MRYTDFGDEGISEIIASGILKRLKVLDLRHGCVTDEGARLLAECPDVGGLELLDLGRNQLTAQGVRLLRSAGAKLRADDQHAEGSQEYLSEGDFE